MLERWEFIQFPCAKDQNRYKLKVKSTEEDLIKILRLLNCNSGRSFASLSHEYNWGVYFYGVTLEECNRIVEILKKMCNKGGIAQSDITMTQELAPMFEEFLEVTAKQLKDEHYGEKVEDPVKEGKNSELPVVDLEEMRGDDQPAKTKEPQQETGDESLKIVPNISRQFFEDEPAAPLLNKEQITGIQRDDRSMFDGGIKPETAKPQEQPGAEKTDGVEIFSSHEIRPETQASKPEAEEKPLSQAPVSNEIKADAAPSRTELDPKTMLNPRYTMNEFIVGSNNRFTHAAAKAVADNPGKIYNPLFIYGGVGLGKTHLMHAVGHYVLQKNSQAVVLCVTTEKFMSEVIEAIGKGTLQEFREKYRKIDVLLIDDIQFLSESESTQEEFFHTFNMLHENGKQIIITSDRPPKLLTTLEDRLRSRFEWGLIADIKSPTLEARIAILKKKNEGSTVNLDENMLLYIASKLKSNIRELEGFLKRINAYASLTGQEVTMELVRSIMSELLPEEEMEEEKKSVPVPPPSRPAVNIEPINSQVQPPAAVFKEQPVIIQHSPINRPAPQPPASALPAGLAQAAPSSPPPKPPSMQNASPKPQPSLTGGANKDDADAALIPVEVAFFYPQGKESEFNTMKDKFKQVIKKHKLKFRFESIFERTYDHSGKINYAFFTELCKTNNIHIVVVLGIPPNQNVTNDDFSSLLGAMMEDEKISMQYVPWTELSKDYRYLNLALDITLLRNKKHEA